MKVRSIFLTIVFSCFALLPGDAAQRLTILHTNDVHGHLLPYSYPAIASTWYRETRFEDLPALRDIGGIARRATLVARVRADLTKQGTPVWLVDAGDFHHYSAFSNEYHGEADVIAMNRAGYDFATFGNHEFNNTLAQFKKLIGEARFDFLCANATDKATGRPLTKRYEVRQVGDVRVAVFGLVTNSAADYPAAKEGVQVEDVFAVAPEVVALLRGQEKADIVVLISHCGEFVDRRIARDVPGIDVIVGGHSHSRLPYGEVIWWSDELKPDEVNGTVIVQAFQYAGELGRLDLLLDKNETGQWRVSRYQEHLIPVTSQIPDDPAVAAVLDSLWAPFAAKYDEVVATATADFAVRGDDFPQNNLVADAVRAECGVDVTFEDVGGMHIPIVAGPVTRAMLVDLDQSASTIVTFRMRGKEIRRLVQRFRPVASGLRYRMVFGKLEDISVGGASLNDTRVYSCATSSSFVERLDGFDVLEKKNTKRPWSGVVIDAMRRAGAITPAYDGRRVVVDTLR